MLLHALAAIKGIECGIYLPPNSFVFFIFQENVRYLMLFLWRVCRNVELLCTIFLLLCTIVLQNVLLSILRKYLCYFADLCCHGLCFFFLLNDVV